MKLRYTDRSKDDVKDVKIYLVSLGDLVRTKEFSGRMQDFSDIKMLKKVRDYL